jgi:hypothetical protein
VSQRSLDDRELANQQTSALTRSPAARAARVLLIRQPPVQESAKWPMFRASRGATIAAVQQAPVGTDGSASRGTRVKEKQ